jgi:hypothetical protein
MRFDASSSDPPKYWAKPPASSDHPRSRIASRISSRIASHSPTLCSAPIIDAIATARSSATQHISFE